MYFNLKRFYYGIVKRQRVLLLMLIIPCAYLAVAALIADRFIVEQSVAITDEIPVASAVNPLAFRSFREIKNNPSNFFANQFDVNNSARMVASSWYEKYSLKMIKQAIMNCTFSPAEDANQIRIRYQGKYLELGRILVNYYSDRLVIKAEEGLNRSNVAQDERFKPELKGELQIKKLGALWRSDRTIPFIISIAVSMLIVFSLLLFLEWGDASLKSERQIARYTGLPILGRVPDLNKVSERIGAEADHS